MHRPFGQKASLLAGLLTCLLALLAAPGAALAAWTLTTVDSAGNINYRSSIAIGADDLPVISYVEDTNGDLRVIKCGDAACSLGNTITTVVSAGARYHDAIAIGVDGFPAIAYLDDFNNDLKFAKCGNAICSSGNTITTVDSTASAGWDASITIGTDGFPIISYLADDGSGGDLKVAKCGNAACNSGNTITTVDSAGFVGRWPSIAIGTDGLPVISYYDQTNIDLKVAKCGNTTCNLGNTLTTVDSAGNVGYRSSIAISTDGFPIISYVDGNNSTLKVVKCGNASCSAGNTITTVDSSNPVGNYSSIAIGANGFPEISYTTGSFGNYGLKFAKCGNAACSSGNTITTVDSAGNVGISPSMVIGADGLPVMSYIDVTNLDLKVAKESGGGGGGGVDCGVRMYDGTATINLSCEDPPVSPLRIQKGATTYGIQLVPTADPNASKLRIQIPGGVRALRKQ